MPIHFTKEQYLTLMKMAYLASWLMNAHRTDDTITEYKDLDEMIFKHAKEYGLGEYADDESVGDQRCYPTRAFEEGFHLHDLIDDYDNETFWDELEDRFVFRELLRRYDIEALQQMDWQTRYKKRDEFVEKYEKEFFHHGIDRLEIVAEPTKKTGRNEPCRCGSTKKFKQCCLDEK